jgi:hypothetical protein
MNNSNNIYLLLNFLSILSISMNILLSQDLFITKFKQNNKYSNKKYISQYFTK